MTERRDQRPPYPTAWFVGLAVVLAIVFVAIAMQSRTTPNRSRLLLAGAAPLLDLIVVAVAWRIAPIWGRRVITLQLWAAVQGLFLLIPPIAGVALNLALAAGFVWWFALRGGPTARRRRVIFRLRPVPPAVVRRLPFVAMPLIGLVTASLVVVPRVIPFPPPRTDPLEMYLRQPFAVIPVLLLVAVIAPLAEEFLFRGWIQRSLERRLPPAQAIGATALIFAAAHFELFGLPIRLVFGLVAGFIAWSTRSIWPGVFLHGLYNASLVGLGSATPGVDEAVLTRWAHTPAVFWPVVVGFVASGLAMVAALSSIRLAVLRRLPNGVVTD